MAPNETNENLESIHTDVETKEKGWIETTTKNEYFLNRATGEVILVETVDVDNPYPNARQAKDKEISRKIMPLSLLPSEVREKVKTLMETKKNI
jgi:hypothetical protein